MDNLLSVRQVAYILKVHHLTIRRYIKEGKLKAVRAAGNVRVKESDLQLFQQELTPPPPTANAEEVITRAKRQLARPFTTDDPLLRLSGRGASLN